MPTVANAALVEAYADNSSWSTLVKAGPPAYVKTGQNAEKTMVAEGLERRRDPVTGHSSLHASKDFKAGDLLHKFSAEEYLSSPNFLSVQVGENSHIILHPAYLQYINHSCAPNAYFNTTTFELEALTDISAGDELCFFYPSTEWDMESPFNCCCSSSNCVGRVAGAKYLSPDAIARYRFNAHISALLKQESKV